MSPASEGLPDDATARPVDSNPSPASVRAELEKILASSPFDRSARLSRFLRFIVEETLKGRKDLKEYVLGIEVFDRGESFDPRTENIVRVEARRLRTSLIEYYATTGSGDRISIELPRGTYTPVFRTRVPPTEAGSKRPLVLRAKLIIAAAAFGLAGAATYAVVNLSRSSLGTPPRAIAVLPFVNQTGDPELEFLCDGVSEEIINALAKEDRLRVVARTSSFQFKGRSENVREIARKLNVAGVVEGSISKVGDRLRISTRLIQADSGYSRWSETYDRDIQDTFGVPQEIGRALVRTLGGQARLDEVPAGSGVNVEAWILYQKGRAFWAKWTPEGVSKSIEYFEAAIAKSPDYALAYAGLADAWGVVGHWGVVAPREATLKRDAALGRAMELGPQLAEVRTPLAMRKAFYEWDWIGAEREFRSILKTAPGSSEVFVSFAVVLQAMGRFDEARSIADRALAVDPLWPRANLLPAWLLFHQGQYDSAIEHARKLLEMDPNQAAAFTIIGRSYERKRKYTEAIQYLEKAVSLSPGNAEIIAALGYAYAQSGNRAGAQEVLRRLHELAARRRVSPVQLAIVHAGLGQSKTALDHLEKGYAERDGMLIQLKVNPYYENLRGEPGFRNLLKRIGLDW
jgi:serine/threonine-protein kinase